MTALLVVLGAVAYLGAGLGIVSAIQLSDEGAEPWALLVIWALWPVVLIAAVVRGLFTTRKQ